MLFNQKTPVNGVFDSGHWQKHTQTDIATFRLNEPRGLFSVKKYIYGTSVMPIKYAYRRH